MLATAGRPARARAALVATALLVGGLAASAPVAHASPAAARSGAAPGNGQVVGRASGGYSLIEPAAVTTRNATTVVAWTETGRVPHRLKVRLQRGTGGWRAGALSTGGLDTLGPVSLLDARAQGRLVLTSQAYRSADTAGTIGTWLWVSTNNGRTWRGPTRVWNSVGTSETASDGAGGFWLITGNVGVTVARVPANLRPQSFPADEITLTDRIASRSLMDIATVGSARVPLTYFSTATSGFVHVGATPGRARDRLVWPVQPHDAALAGDARAARSVAARGTASCPVCVRELPRAAGARVGPLRRVSRSAEAVKAVALTMLPGPRGTATGRSAIGWLTDAGQIMTASTAASGRPRSPRSIATFPSGNRSFPDSIALSPRWVIAAAHEGADLHGVVLGFRR